MNHQSAAARLGSFRAPNEDLGPLSAESAWRIVAAAGDVSFILDEEGIVRNVAISSAELAQRGMGDWIGDALIDHVTVESKPKIREMLAHAEAGAAARWRQVNHVTGGGEVPVPYMTVRTGTAGRLIAIGRDMRGMAAMQQRLLQTQQSLERDYMRLRQAEARYRLLFDIAGEPMLIVDVGTRRIREANPTAHRVLGAREGTLAGQPATLLVGAAEQDDMIAFFGAAAAGEVAPTTAARSASRRRCSGRTDRLFCSCGSRPRRIPPATPATVRRSARSSSACRMPSSSPIAGW